MNWWIKQWPHIVISHHLERLLTQFGRKVDQVVFRNTLHLEWRWLGGEWLRSRKLLTGNIRCRHRAVFHFPQRLASETVECVNEPLLGYL